MNRFRTRYLILLAMVALLPACGPTEKPVPLEVGIEEASKATQGGIELRKNQPKKPSAEPKRTGLDASFPGSD